VAEHLVECGDRCQDSTAGDDRPPRIPTIYESGVRANYGQGPRDGYHRCASPASSWP